VLEYECLRRTTLILRLIPRAIAPHVLWLLVLVLALVAEHLVEEAELRRRGDEPCREDDENAGKTCHDCDTIIGACGKVTVLKSLARMKWVMWSFEGLQTRQGYRDPPARWSAEKSARFESFAIEALQAHQNLTTTTTTTTHTTPQFAIPYRSVRRLCFLPCILRELTAPTACISCSCPTRRTRPSASTRSKKSSTARSARARIRRAFRQMTSTRGIGLRSRSATTCS
jgi:hypothetical protein